MAYKTIIFIFGTILFMEVHGLGVVIHKLDPCENKDYPLKITFNVDVNPQGVPVVSGDLDLSETIDDKYRGSLEASVLVFGKWTKMLSLNEKDPCNLFKKYGGELFLELEQAVGLSGTCPIPKGKYHLENFNVDLNKITMKLPTGKAKGQVKLLKEEEVQYCLDFMVELK